MLVICKANRVLNLRGNGLLNLSLTISAILATVGIISDDFDRLMPGRNENTFPTIVLGVVGCYHELHFPLRLQYVRSFPSMGGQLPHGWHRLGLGCVSLSSLRVCL